MPPPERSLTSAAGVAAVGAAAVVGAVVGAEVVVGAAVGLAAVGGARGVAAAALGASTALREVGDWDLVAGDRLRLERRESRSLPYVVHAGDVLRWEFCVRYHDVAFRVSERAMSSGGAVELDLLPAARFAAGHAYGGAWTAAKTTTLLLTFDNGYSRLRGKDVAYAVSVGPAGALPEPPRESAQQAYRREWADLHNR